MTKTAQMCSYCETREMVPIPHKDGGYTTFFGCPNCDLSDKGKTYKNSYDGAGPKR